MQCSSVNRMSFGARYTKDVYRAPRYFRELAIKTVLFKWNLYILFKLLFKHKRRSNNRFYWSINGFQVHYTT